MAPIAFLWIASGIDGMGVAIVPAVSGLIDGVPLLVTRRTEIALMTFEAVLFVLLGPGLMRAQPVQEMILGFNALQIFVTGDALEVRRFFGG